MATGQKPPSLRPTALWARLSVGDWDGIIGSASSEARGALDPWKFPDVGERFQDGSGRQLGDGTNAKTRRATCVLCRHDTSLCPAISSGSAGWFCWLVVLLLVRWVGPIAASMDL